MGRPRIEEDPIVRRKKYRVKHRDKIRNQEENESNQSKIRNRLMKYKYGINLDEYNALFKNQNGKCRICRKKETNKYKKHLAVDHCHKTNKVRGLLCHRCNVGIGLFCEDSKVMLAAVKYLTVNE